MSKIINSEAVPEYKTNWLELIVAVSSATIVMYVTLTGLFALFMLYGTFAGVLAASMVVAFIAGIAGLV